MAAAASSEVSPLGSSCLEAATKIQDVGYDFYIPSESWEDFPRKVEVLRAKHGFWKAEFEKYVGLLSDKALIEALRRARVQLESERAKLLKGREKKKKSSSQCFRCWGGASSGKVLFREDIGNSVQDAIAAFDLIPGFRRAEEEAAAAFERQILPIRKDHRYVPLKTSERAIYSALENSRGPAVVLLYGGPGKGKSSLAQSTAVHYCIKPLAGAVFERVIFLECGAQADAAAKQLELSQLLGLDAALLQYHGPAGEELTISYLLSAQLKRKKILLIFDDVWEEDFLKSMVGLCSGHDTVKYLVTSRRKDLYKDSSISSVRIQVEDIQLSDARKILASHVGLPNRLIPQHLQGTANKIIQATAANPLALALIGADIEHKLCDQDGEWGHNGEWDAVSERLFQILQTEDAAKVHERYPRGVWSTMRMASEALKEDEKKMLVLLDMCKGLPIPEAVLHFLYRGTNVQGAAASFDKTKREIQGRELVSINRFSDSPGELLSWSVHPLEKQFIEEVVMKRGESAFTYLGGVWNIELEAKPEKEQVNDFSEVEGDVIVTMGALYFDSRFAKRLAAKMKLSSDRLTDVRRTAIQPITRLLGLSISQHWTDSLRKSASQVFVQYIQNGVLYDQGVSNLLVSPVSAPSMLSTLRDIAILEEKPLLDENTKGFMSALAGVLADKDGADVGIREAAGRALFCLLDNKQHSVFIVSKCPDVLEAIVTVLLTDSSNLELQIWAAWILGNLGQSNDDSTSQGVVRHPRALVALLRSLSRKDSPRLQRGAAWTLSNLAKSDDETIREIVNAPDIVEEFVKLLSEENDRHVKAQVAIVLANLAGGDGEMKLKIVTCPGALEVLVQSLSIDSNPDLQRHAARALASLAAGDSETKLKILDSPLALDQLVKSLSKDSSHFLQKHAARGLANLAAGDAEKKVRIVNCPSALEELLKALAKESNSDLQDHAARTLANLTAGDADLKERIMNVPGMLEELLTSMRRDGNDLLHEHAANALANLAAGDSESKLKIVCFPRAVDDLVKYLSMNDKPVLQRHAARAFARLSVGDNETRRLLLIKPGVVKELEKCAANNNDNTDLQKQAAKAIFHLKRQSSRKKSLSRN